MGQTTQDTKRYQHKQIAKGLCRACPKPLAADSAIYCEEHNAIRRAQRGVKMSHAKRNEKHDEIAEYALAHPFTTLRELAEMFDGQIQAIVSAFRKRGIASGWMKEDQV